MSEEADGFNVATTRQKAGSELKGGTLRPPLYPRPKPAVLAVTLPGTSGTGPSVPASAEEPPPPRPAGFAGTVNAPAFTTCATVITVFGSDSEASLSQTTGVRGAFCATATPGMSTTVRINTKRKGLLSSPQPDGSSFALFAILRKPASTGLSCPLSNKQGTAVESLTCQSSESDLTDCCSFKRCLCR